MASAFSSKDTASSASEKDRHESEEHKSLVGQKVKLSDGTYNFVFTRHVDDTFHPYWRCNICDCTVLGSLYKHTLGRKHSSKISAENHPTCLWNKKFEKPTSFKLVPGEPVPPGFEDEVTNMTDVQTKDEKPASLDFRLAPGEPVPPGFEDEVRGVTEIQSSLDSFHSGPLIGLEYLIELSAFEDEREPQYVCLLCDKRGDPRTVMAHLVSFNHRMTYLQQHFPTAYRAISPYNTKQYRRNVQTIVQNICEAIEKKFGRMVPQAADKETFERKKQSYIEAVVKDNHPSERLGETFEHLVNRDAILAGPKDTLTEIKKANVLALRGRNYRKGMGKKDPSPPVVAVPAVKRTNQPKSDRRSLSSISSISSSSLSSPHSLSRSRSRSRSRDRDRDLHWERDRSPRGRRGGGGYGPSHRRSGGGGSSYRRSRSRSPARRYYQRRSRSSSRSPPAVRYRRESYYVGGGGGGNRMPWQRPEYGKSRVMERKDTGRDVRSDRYEEYRKQCSELERDMQKVLEQHERNPEKHPAYPEEWKIFWNRRYKELQAENKDPTKHDFKPEWIDFWNKRMKEMHDSELKTKKDAIRKRLNLPEEPAPISFKIGNGKKDNEHSTDDGGGHHHRNRKTDLDDVIIIDDSKDDDRGGRRSKSPWEMERYGGNNRRENNDVVITIDDATKDRGDRGGRGERRERQERDRSRSPWEQDNLTRDRYRHRNNAQFKRNSVPCPETTVSSSNENINIVAILRLLTALEDKLGSLGPKTIEMLSQALALEKAEANSADTILDDEKNCVLFETVKEKLKGQLLAGMVETHQEKTFKDAIQKVAALLHVASERSKDREKELKIKQLAPVKIPGIGSVDKAAIAKQISYALVAQGKTDVTESELEQLINAVVGIAQAGVGAGAGATASFVRHLTTAADPDPNPNPTRDRPKVSSARQSLQQSSSTTNDAMTDSDLKTLLQNFQDLSTDEQHNLINYLKELEAREPERVERLRKFVDLKDGYTSASSAGRTSPFSNRESGCNPSVDEKPPESTTLPIKFKIDSDDEDDYSFEDVFRAAKKNVAEKEQLTKATEKTTTTTTTATKTLNLTDAKNIIASLVGKISSTMTTTASTTGGVNFLGLSTMSRSQPQQYSFPPPPAAAAAAATATTATKYYPPSQYPVAQPVPAPTPAPQTQQQTSGYNIIYGGGTQDNVPVQDYNTFNISPITSAPRPMPPYRQPTSQQQYPPPPYDPRQTYY